MFKKGHNVIVCTTIVRKRLSYDEKNINIVAFSTCNTLLSKIGILKSPTKSSQVFWGYVSTVLIFAKPKIIL